MSTVLPGIFTGEQLASFDAFYFAVSTGVWGEETPFALTEIGAALAASGVVVDTYFSLVDQYTKAVAAPDGAVQHQLLKQIADGISRMAYENARRRLSFKVQRFAEHPDFSFLRGNLRVEDRAVLTLGGSQRKPEVRMQASSGRRHPIDDATFARQILERQMEPGAKPLERSDPLYERLLGVIDRQVIKWPAIYKIPDLDTIWRRIRRGFPVSSARFYTFVSSSYAVGIAKNGYDPHKLTDIKLDGLTDALKEAWKFERPAFEKIKETEQRLDKLVNAFLDGSVEKEIYLVKKNELIHTKTALLEKKDNFLRKRNN